MQPDVCIVGGGPAGLSAAVAFRLAGYSVVVLDPAVPPIDKACGEGLMPDTLGALSQLGVNVPLCEGFAFRGIRFLRGGCRAQAEFPSGSAVGLRRTVLHRVLAERANQLDVDLRWGVKKVRYTQTGVESEQATVKARLIVGADGLNSRVRQAAGLQNIAHFKQRYGFRRHYAVKPWTPYVEVYWARHAQVYVTPISPDEIGVALLTVDPRQRLDQALALFPELAARLSHARPTSSEMGAITATRRLRSVYRNGVALIGDASGSVDAITGEGVGLAVKQSALLVQAFRTDSLDAYSQAHRRLGRRAAAMSEVMLQFSRSGALQQPVIHVLARFPAIFTRLLAFHVGAHASGVVTTSGGANVSRPNPECLNSQS